MQLHNICFENLTDKPTTPFYIFHFDGAKAMPFCPTIWHEEMLLAFVADGTCDITVDGTNHTLHEKDVVVLPPFTLYTLNNYSTAKLTCCLANLRALQHSKNNLVYLPSSQMDCIVHVGEEKYPQILQALAQLEKDNGNDYMCLIDVQNILHWLHANQTNQTDITVDKHLFCIKNALNIVHTQKEQIVVEQVAQRCGYSEFYLMKLFKKFTNYSCIDYSINHKLVVIATQICTCNDDFCTLAQNAGFANISYFNRQFKKLFGATPKQFRKLHKKSL